MPINLNPNVSKLRQFILNCLEDNTKPFLTHSRLPDDFQRIKKCLQGSIATLTPQDLEIFFPVVLCLQGYNIVNTNTLENKIIWEISFEPLGNSYSSGLGVIAENLGEFEGLIDLMNRHGYKHGVFYTKFPASINDMEYNTKIIKQDELENLFMVLATYEYIDIFLMIINTIPSLKENLSSLLVDHTQLPLETLTAISQKWGLITEQLRG